MFIVALERGAEVLASVDRLDEISFEPKCSSHLLKMNYCQECNGSAKVKSCRGYCFNVMRGCLTQHVGSLDRPWTTYAQSLEALVHIVRSKDGYETVLRGLDGRLSEAVMHFMQHGSELEQKVTFRLRIFSFYFIRFLLRTSTKLLRLDDSWGIALLAVSSWFCVLFYTFIIRLTMCGKRLN